MLKLKFMILAFFPNRMAKTRHFRMVAVSVNMEAASNLLSRPLAMKISN